LNHGLDTGFLVALEISEHPSHASANFELSRLIKAGDRLSLVPQVLSEFVHIVTDSRRFQNPLSNDHARDLAEQWWDAAEVDHVFPDEDTVNTFFDWHRTHQLGRKRLLDTLMAATYQNAGVTSILTTNPKDFAVFQVFQCITP